MDYITMDIQKSAPWSLLYADDVVLIAESLTEVQSDLTLWQESLERRGMRVNREKTVYMYCNFSGAKMDVTPHVHLSKVDLLKEFKSLSISDPL
ncbi:unnamed protein product [Parnassius mnemosyne]|uniref:Reverse transcriptase domain-containing protein n=1 Tax=Parnassius mnemosyne TaxID=213953 RepID=A0AAV1KW25_9NEOP